MARIHQLQSFVGNKADIDTADATYCTIFHSLRTVAGQCYVKRTQSGDFYLVTLGERQTQLLYKSLDSVLHISRCERSIRLDRIRQLIDVHNSHSTRFLTYVIQ